MFTLPEKLQGIQKSLTYRLTQVIDCASVFTCFYYSVCAREYVYIYTYVCTCISYMHMGHFLFLTHMRVQIFSYILRVSSSNLGGSALTWFYYLIERPFSKFIDCSNQVLYCSSLQSQVQSQGSHTLFRSYVSSIFLYQVFINFLWSGILDEYSLVYKMLLSSALSVLPSQLDSVAVCEFLAGTEPSKMYLTHHIPSENMQRQLASALWMLIMIIG